MSSPPAKKPRSETDEGLKVTNQQLDLEESASTARSKVEGKLQQSWSDVDKCASQNVKHNFRAIRAILSTNTEIWNRCKPHLLRAENRNSGRAQADFFRDVWTSVQATTEGTDRIHFKASCKTCTKMFTIGFLCFFPSHLAIFQLEYSLTFSDGLKMIDYESLLERSLVLNSTTLEPYLLELKKYLETVQVWLGRIDAWLMKSQFLESSLGPWDPLPDGSLELRKSVNCMGL